MTPLDALSPDQRAVLQLLLKQGKRYDELAALLRIDPGAVRQRAVSALDALGPETELVAGRRAELTDWLLGQQDPAESERTVEYVEAAPAAQAWAASIAAALREGGLGGDRLPEVPAGDGASAPEAEAELEPEVPEAPDGAIEPVDPEALDEPEAGEEPAEPAPALRPVPGDGAERMPGFSPAPGDGAREPASRLGGALLLAGVVIVLAVALVYILSRDDDGGDTDTPTVAAQTQTTATTPTTTTPAGEPRIAGQVNLAAPDGGKALGVANVLAQGDDRAIAIQAQDLEPNTRRNAYGVWLTGGPDGRVARLGFAPAVGRNGRLEGAASLPENAGDFSRLVIALETESDPAEPGAVALSGRLRLG